MINQFNKLICYLFTLLLPSFAFGTAEQFDAALENTNALSDLLALPAEIPPPAQIDILQLLMPIAFVLGLIFALAWFVRRFNTALPINNKVIEQLSSLQISNQTRISLIRVGNKDMLIGMTPNTISHLYTFDEQVAIPDEVMPDLAKQFKTLLKKK